MSFWFKHKKGLQLFGIFILGGILLPFIVNFLFGIILNYIPGKMHVNDPDTWISFLGGYLGAGLTLLGVYWQIDFSKQEKRLEKITDTYIAYDLLSDLTIGMHDSEIHVSVLLKRFLKDNNELEPLKEKMVGKEFQEKLNRIYDLLPNVLPEEKLRIIRKLFWVKTSARISGTNLESIDNNNSNKKLIKQEIERFSKNGSFSQWSEVQSMSGDFTKKYEKELGMEGNRILIK